MKAIILAAGRGLRLNGACGDIPKCLLRVGGKSLIERQFRCIQRLRISDVVVVVGFKSDQVRAACGTGMRFIENPIFDRTNSLYSLWLARDELSEGFLVLNSDVLFHPALLDRLLRCDYEDALLASLRQRNMPLLGDEEMKVRVEGDRLLDISKSMAPSEAHGENVGIARFGVDGARLFIDLMNSEISGGGHKEWVPRVFQRFVAHRDLHVVDTAPYPWIEIDFPEDYHQAVAEVFPEMSLMMARRATSRESTAIGQVRSG